MYTGLHVKYRLLLADFNEDLIFFKLFRKILDKKFHENSSSGNRDFSLGRANGQADITKLIVAFRNTAKFYGTIMNRLDFAWN